MRPTGWRRLLLLATLLAGIGACGAREPTEPGTTGPAAADSTGPERFWELYRSATDARTGGRSDEAIGLYRQVLEIRPEHADSLHLLAQLLYARGDVDGARERLATLTRTENHSLRGFQQLSVVEGMPAPGRVAAPEHALGIVARAIDWNPGNSGAQGQRARWAAYAGLEREVEEALAAALGHNPRELQAALVADWLARRDDPEAPADVLVRLCEAVDCASRAESAAALAAAEAFGRLPKVGEPVSRALAELPPGFRSRVDGAGRIRPVDPSETVPLSLRAELDLDADGSPDLTVTAGSVGEPARLSAILDGTLVDLPADRPVPGWNPGASEAGNVAAPWRGAFLDGSEGPLVVLLGGGSRPVRLYARDGGGAWRVEPAPGLPDRVYGSVLATGDLDGDGFTDLVVGNVEDDGPFGSRLLYATPGGGFEPSPLPLPPLSAALAVDLDGDGDLDLLAALDPDGAGVEEGRGTSVLRALLNEEGRLREAPGDFLPALAAAVSDLGLLVSGSSTEIYVATGDLAPESPFPDRLLRHRGDRFVDVTHELGPERFADTVRVLPDGIGRLRLLRGGLVPGDPRRLYAVSVDGGSEAVTGAVGGPQGLP